MRSTAIRWNFREYRFRFTLQFLSLQSVPSELSQFKGSVHSTNRESLVSPHCLGVARQPGAIAIIPNEPT
jgi:hypothetical protein